MLCNVRKETHHNLTTIKFMERPSNARKLQIKKPRIRRAYAHQMRGIGSTRTRGSYSAAGGIHEAQDLHVTGIKLMA